MKKDFPYHTYFRAEVDFDSDKKNFLAKLDQAKIYFKRLQAKQQDLTVLENEVKKVMNLFKKIYRLWNEENEHDEAVATKFRQKSFDVLNRFAVYNYQNNLDKNYIHLKQYEVLYALQNLDDFSTVICDEQQDLADFARRIVEHYLDHPNEGVYL